MWKVYQWTREGVVSGFSVSNIIPLPKDAEVKDEAILFRVFHPSMQPEQLQRATDYCAYLNLLEERQKETTIVSAVAQRFKEK